jgi:hypothetical protein
MIDHTSVHDLDLLVKQYRIIFLTKGGDSGVRGGLARLGTVWNDPWSDPCNTNQDVPGSSLERSTLERCQACSGAR